MVFSGFSVEANVPFHILIYPISSPINQTYSSQHCYKSFFSRNLIRRSLLRPYVIINSFEVDEEHIYIYIARSHNQIYPFLKQGSGDRRCLQLLLISPCLYRHLHLSWSLLVITTHAPRHASYRRLPFMQ